MTLLGINTECQGPNIPHPQILFIPKQHMLKSQNTAGWMTEISRQLMK